MCGIVEADLSEMALVQETTPSYLHSEGEPCGLSILVFASTIPTSYANS